jgi:hypothetical protein
MVRTITITRRMSCDGFTFNLVPTSGTKLATLTSLAKTNMCHGLVFSTVELNGKRREPDGAMTAKKVWLQRAVPKIAQAIAD